MSIFIFVLAIGILICGYIFYGNYVAKIFGLDPRRKTPAFTKYDGVDYVPAKNWLMLFGHHFASIAGAGPIIGPILAYLWWGWLPALIWIVLGTIFMGAVHDFSALIVSIREGGVSLGQVAEKYISRRAGIIFLIFIWFALILVIAVFAAICAKSFIKQPQIITPSLGLIPIAIIVGFLIYRLKVNITISTLIGIGGLALLMFLGKNYPFKLTLGHPYILWVSLLLVYAYFASIVPVDVLLQPRDYLSSFLLFFGITVTFVGLVSKPLPIANAKVFIANSPAGYWFPIMFITIACGAISGFHSLVSSGTTSKQITNETNAKKIGYGAMVMEGILATIVLFSVAFGLKHIPAGKPDVAQIFSLGFASVGSFLGSYAQFIAFVILNIFILTTLDTATRITRFITQELLKINNKWLATGIVITAAGYFSLMNKWQIIWPVFGASNQLVAGLSLIVVSGWLSCKGKKYKITAIPGLLMVFITICALGAKTVDFLSKKNYTLSVIGIILIVLGLFSLMEFRRVVKCKVS